MVLSTIIYLKFEGNLNSKETPYEMKYIMHAQQEQKEMALCEG